MKAFCLTSFIVLGMLAGHLKAQQAVLTAGNFHTSTAGSISWSLGDLAIKTLSYDDLILTQGFQQSYLVGVNVDNYAAWYMQIDVFPNPTRDLLNIRINDLMFENASYKLYNLFGQLLEHDNLGKYNNEILFSNYEPGVYLLKITIGSNIVRTIKVIKS
jgi:hypothetical protein